MIRTYRYRIKDSSAAPQLNKLARACNFVWNFCNESQEHALRWNQRWPTGFELSKLTAGCSKELGLHSQTVQAVCEQYETRRYGIEVLIVNKFIVHEHLSYEEISAWYRANQSDDRDRERIGLFLRLTVSPLRCRMYLFPDFQFNAKEYAQR